MCAQQMVEQMQMAFDRVIERSDYSRFLLFFSFSTSTVVTFLFFGYP